jgi:hypothetical protein
MSRNQKMPNVGAYENPPAIPWSGDPSPVDLTPAEQHRMTADVATARPSGTDHSAVEVFASPIGFLLWTQDEAELTWDGFLAEAWKGENGGLQGVEATSGAVV